MKAARTSGIFYTYRARSLYGARISCLKIKPLCYFKFSIDFILNLTTFDFLIILALNYRLNASR